MCRTFTTRDVKLVININFLHANRSATLFSRFGRGVSVNILAPIISMMIILTSLLICYLIQQHEIANNRVMVEMLQARVKHIQAQIHSENVDISALRVTISIDKQIASARNSGVVTTNLHVRIANALDTRLRLKSITNGSPIVLSGLAPSYSSVGRTIERLSNSFTPRQVMLESVHRVSGMISAPSVAFVLRVSSAVPCCGGVK